MLSINKKILISGCGFSWSGQEKPTWVKLLKILGNSITDVGGPAVSNQFIVNNVVEQLHANEFDYAIVQLTNIGKLDVEIRSAEQQCKLVDNDSLRNFTYNNIWPSSISAEHFSKELYYRWLYSPNLEITSLWKDLILLSAYCKLKNCKLIVIQGYSINWTDEQKESLVDILDTDKVLYNDYKKGVYYSYHDSTNKNTVPCVEYQVSLAEEMSDLLELDIKLKINKIKKQLKIV